MKRSTVKDREVNKVYIIKETVLRVDIIDEITETVNVDPVEPQTETSKRKGNSHPEWKNWERLIKT